MCCAFLMFGIHNVDHTIWCALFFSSSPSLLKLCVWFSSNVSSVVPVFHSCIFDECAIKSFHDHFQSNGLNLQKTNKKKQTNKLAKINGFHVFNMKQNENEFSMCEIPSGVSLNVCMNKFLALYWMFQDCWYISWSFDKLIGCNTDLFLALMKSNLLI